MSTTNPSENGDLSRVVPESNSVSFTGDGNKIADNLIQSENVTVVVENSPPKDQTCDKIPIINDSASEVETVLNPTHITIQKEDVIEVKESDKTINESCAQSIEIDDMEYSARLTERYKDSSDILYPTKFDRRKFQNNSNVTTLNRAQSINLYTTSSDGPSPGHEPHSKFPSFLPSTYAGEIPLMESPWNDWNSDSKQSQSRREIDGKHEEKEEGEEDDKDLFPGKDIDDRMVECPHIFIHEPIDCPSFMTVPMAPSKREALSNKFATISSNSDVTEKSDKDYNAGRGNGGNDDKSYDDLKSEKKRK